MFEPAGKPGICLQKEERERKADREEIRVGRAGI